MRIGLLSSRVSSVSLQLRRALISRGVAYVATPPGCRSREMRRICAFLLLSLFFRYPDVLIKSLDGVLFEFSRPRGERQKQPEAKGTQRRGPSRVAPRFFERIPAIRHGDVLF